MLVHEFKNKTNDLFPINKKQKKQRIESIELLFRSSNCINCKRQWQKYAGKSVSIKDKRGDTFNCVNMCGLQRINEFGKCPICGTQVVRKPTYHITIKRFNLIIDENQKIINEKFNDQSGIMTLKDLNIKILLPIGKKFYSVPFIHFVQFYNLGNNEKDDLIKFFEWIQTHCTSFDI